MSSIEAQNTAIKILGVLVLDHLEVNQTTQVVYLKDPERYGYHGSNRMEVDDPLEIFGFTTDGQKVKIKLVNYQTQLIWNKKTIEGKST